MRRKRGRNLHSHKRFKLKESVEKGSEHLSRSGNLVPAKKFTPQSTCKCHRKCAEKITTDRQKKIFDDYYKRSSWVQKTLFLRARIKQKKTRTNKSSLYPIIPLKKRQFSFEYSLTDANETEIGVCRDFFLRCLNVSAMRVNRALKSKIANPTGNERRGRGPPKNKTSTESKKEVIGFINAFPKYESHYGRSKSARKYLPPGLNKTIMYAEYRNMCTAKRLTPVSNYMFRQILNTEFNLSFKKRCTDTCKTCDEIHASMNSTITTKQRKTELQRLNTVHKNLVKFTNAMFFEDVEASKTPESGTVVLTFDLQKTLQTPLISTSAAFYKRQLWTYNFCIYNETEQRAYMFVWSEDVASRGAQEVGSCILRYLKQYLPANIVHLICYSDACGGQNRNIKLALLFKKYLHGGTNTTVKKIEHKFFVSGHSYNACDRCFGLIEKKARGATNIYTPADWAELIATTQKKEPRFTVIVMNATDFFSTSILETQITNRKKDANGKKINWFDIQSISYEIDEPFFLLLNTGDAQLHRICIKKNSVPDQLFQTSELTALFPFGHKISKKKKIDLLFLLKFIPSEHHEFYKNLRCDDDDDNDEDFGMASDFSDEF